MSIFSNIDFIQQVNDLLLFMNNDKSDSSNEKKKILFAKLTKLFIQNLDDDDKNVAFIFNDIRPKLTTFMDSINKSHNKHYSLKINELYGKHSLIKRVFRYHQYDDIKKYLTQKSIILYFKEANLFAIYEGDDIYKFIITEIEHPMFHDKEIYEFIPEDRPQKLVIMIENDHCIIEVKKYLYKYIKESFREISKKFVCSSN